MSRLQVVWFLLWRAWFGAACGLAVWLSRLGAPGWMVEWGGRAAGTRYAFRACRRVGWHPFSGEG